MKKLLTSLILSCLAIGLNAKEPAHEDQSMDEMWGDQTVAMEAQKAERLAWFDRQNYSMFIHWGLYSHLAGKWKGETYYGIGEWIMNRRMANIPADEYMEVAKEFNPVDFDAMAIAQLAKDAGMKYIIITSKHHDGFAMFDSEVSDFNIVDATPFGRDPMKELAEACEELGLGFGFYYSHYQDWTAPGGAGGPKEKADGTPASFGDYFYSKCLPQVIEICSNYGEIDFVWFDTPGRMSKELVVQLVDTVRELQPGALLCSRVGHGMGDYASKGDMEVPLENIEGAWETCDTTNDAWCYMWYDTHWKSPKTILNRLVSTVARGGSYLLNVGPDDKGVVPEIPTKYLLKAGEWIKKYPQVIYGAGSSPWGRELAWGDVTTHGNKMFLSVFDWPRDGQLYLPGLDSGIVSAKLLDGNQKTDLAYEMKNGWTVFNVPISPVETLASVIELELNGPAAEVAVDTDYGIYPNTKNNLLTLFAEVTDGQKRKIRWMEKFGEWIHVTQAGMLEENNKIEWTVNVYEPGKYYVDARFRGRNKLVWKLTTDEGALVQNRFNAVMKYVDDELGIVEFENPGKHTLTVSLLDGHRPTASLESIKIYPVE